MNWLERARREIQESTAPATANTAEGNPTAVTAVPQSAVVTKSGASIGSNGSAPSADLAEVAAAKEDFEERAGIMEFDGGLSRDEAERAARALILDRYRLH